jgi:G3E family GTPase
MPKAGQQKPSPAPARIPVALVTGFLGSGKTTFLQRIPARYPSRRLVLLVNEFSDLDVDTARLSADSSAELVSLPGGSIFCRCLASEFIRVLERLAEAKPRWDGIVIEASGMANPLVIQQLLEEAKLDRAYRLSAIVALADPGTFLKLLRTLPNIPAQIQAADVVLLNKLDLHNDPAIRETEAAIHALNPDARIVRASFAAANIELFGAEPDRSLSGALAPCRDPHYAVCQASVRGPVDVAALSAALVKLGAALYRAKGFLPARGGAPWVYLDYSLGRLQTDPVADFSGAPGLTLIVRGRAVERAERFAAAVERGEFAAR